MSNKQLFKNPYLFKKEDFIVRENNHLYDDLVTLTDSSGYLCLRDQIAIIKEQSSINNEYRRGQIDRFNDEKLKVIEQLSSFEDNDIVVSQLLKARNGDLIDKQDIYSQAYNSGYRSYFFNQNSPEGVQEPPSTVGDGDLKNTEQTVDGKKE